MSEVFTLARHGMPPLKFTGELLAESSSKSHQGPCQARWHELALYRTSGGKLIAAICFRQGETRRETVFVCETESALVDDLQHLLDTYDPHHGWEGHPPGAMDAERKNRLIAETIIGGYHDAMSTLLSKAGIVEEIG